MAEVRRLVNGVYIAATSADVVKIRGDVIEKLVQAVTATNQLAQKASDEPTRSAGGIAPKIHWYRVLGYLVQVLDGICKNVELSEINDRLLKVEKELGGKAKSSSKG